MAKEGELVEFAAGDTIFREGEPGGYFIVIQQGSVFVFKEDGEREVPLAQLGEGEVLGLLTFYNEIPRHASARARTPVVGQIVRKTAALSDDKLPSWVRIVLKEYSSRLSQVNNLYTSAQKRENELLTKVIDPLFISCQVADGIAAIGTYYSKRVDDGRDVIFLGQMAELMTGILGYDKSQIDFILHVFKNYGLIKVELEADTNLEVTSLKSSQKLKWYTAFVRSARSGKEKKLLDSQLPFKYRRVLFGMRDFAQSKGLTLNKQITVQWNELEADFKKVAGTNLDIEAFREAGAIGLLEFTESPDDATIQVNVLELTRTLICMNVIHRLKSDHDI